ncbi:hypothetical protein ACPRNU_18855 [Chromobacterium vaccinii]|uniref:hypothetical protein n=1 Tax=Chromobacterium TaxID=535 RepID=UPI00130532DF|nr:hypothetical protein [Chromobacterium sp. ATCC 53434]
MGISLADNISTKRASSKNPRKSLFFKHSGKNFANGRERRRARAAKLAARGQTSRPMPFSRFFLAAAAIS